MYLKLIVVSVVLMMKIPPTYIKEAQSGISVLEMQGVRCIPLVVSTKRELVSTFLTLVLLHNVYGIILVHVILSV